MHNTVLDSRYIKGSRSEEDDLIETKASPGELIASLLKVL